jgi:hypothetical protein
MEHRAEPGTAGEHAERAQRSELRQRHRLLGGRVLGDESFDTAALIEQDTGAGWAIVSDITPTGDAGGEVLSGMTCMSTGHCVAIGYGGAVSSSKAQTLVEAA